MPNQVLKFLYVLYFSLAKFFIYPKAKIITNFVMPGANIGKGVVIRKHSKIYNVDIGDYTFVNEYTLIESQNTSIGRYCSISHNVKIGVTGHPHSFFSTSPVFYSKSRGYVFRNRFNESQAFGSTQIGNDVLIYSNAVVTAGVKVNDGAIVASGAIVTHDVPAFAIVGGVPAKVIGYRFPNEIINSLVETAWWELDLPHLMSISTKISDLTNVSEFIQEVIRFKEKNEVK